MRSNSALCVPAPIDCTHVFVRHNGLYQGLLPSGGVDSNPVVAQLYWETNAGASPHLVLTNGDTLRAEATLTGRRGSRSPRGVAPPQGASETLCGRCSAKVKANR